MPVNWTVPSADALAPVKGLSIGVTEAGVRKANRKDLTVFLLPDGAAVAGVFTRNRYCAAPVQVCQAHLSEGGGAAIRALVVNTGNANAGTGAQGMADAKRTCVELARRLNIAPAQVLPFSTGVIMEPLPVDRIVAGMDAAIADAKPAQWLKAAEGIMTTDTVPKAASRQVVIGGQTITVTGISKGAGMIRPNMATMLGYVATDACVDAATLQAITSRIADQSFNRITVDGDTSTNDSFVVMATQQAGNARITSADSADGQALEAVLREVAQVLAHAIVRDAEGATKFITVRIEGGATQDECLKAAYAIAHSPLVKTAFFASDPNLGRILAAVGYAGIDDLDQNLIEMHLDDVHVVTKGGRNPAYQEEDGARVMKQAEIKITVNLGRGHLADTVWTCDFSHDYVSINADYRS